MTLAVSWSALIGALLFIFRRQLLRDLLPVPEVIDFRLQEDEDFDSAALDLRDSHDPFGDYPRGRQVVVPMLISLFSMCGLRMLWTAGSPRSGNRSM